MLDGKLKVFPSLSSLHLTLYMTREVCDFGFARKVSKETQEMTICGTDEWMVVAIFYLSWLLANF
jgi:hypothetical protein